MILQPAIDFFGRQSAITAVLGDAADGAHALSRQDASILIGRQQSASKRLPESKQELHTNSTKVRAIAMVQGFRAQTSVNDQVSRMLFARMSR